MKLEITLDNKAKFFAQHFRSSFRYDGSIEMLRVVGGISLNWNIIDHTDGSEHRINKCKLQLKPLSSITDEDAILIAIQNRYTQDVTDLIKAKVGRNILDRIFNKSQMNMCLPFECAYFLRSKGYALPWMGLSVEEMIEAGWIKLEGGGNHE